MRLILWLVLGLLVLFALRSKSKPSKEAMPTSVERDGQAKEVELMLCCSHCGVYFPASEAVRQDQQIFCCPEHHERHFPKA